MCGISAISRAQGRSSIPSGQSFARALALAIEDRGPHATGFGWTVADGWPFYWKAPGRASKVAPLAPLPNKMRNVIIHTRYATKGSPETIVDGTFVNNHPVVAPGLILVHNGVLRNDDELIALVEHERVGSVDSEALPALLALGPLALGEDDPAELLSLVRGDAAVAWLDGESEGLHLARLSGRPLSIGWTKRGDLVAASTSSALYRTAARTGIALRHVSDVKEGTYLHVVDGEIVRRAPIRLADHRPVRQPVAVKPAAKPAQATLPGDIDWDDLVPRRGWTVYRNDAPTGGRGRYRYDVAAQAWVAVD